MIGRDGGAGAISEVGGDGLFTSGTGDVREAGGMVSLGCLEL